MKQNKMLPTFQTLNNFASLLEPLVRLTYLLIYPHNHECSKANNIYTFEVINAYN